MKVWFYEFGRVGSLFLLWEPSVGFAVGFRILCRHGMESGYCRGCRIQARY